MESMLHREVTVHMDEIHCVENLMRCYGIKGATIIYNGSPVAIIDFADDSEYLIFILRDILGKAKEESGLYTQPDFEFMIRLEKKLRTYSKSDEYFIRKALRQK